MTQDNLNKVLSKESSIQAKIQFLETHVQLQHKWQANNSKKEQKKMTKENLNKVETKEATDQVKQNLELEAYEVEGSTVLEEMGASGSIFGNSCSIATKAY